jgi:hypothetical protein
MPRCWLQVRARHNVDRGLTVDRQFMWWDWVHLVRRPLIGPMYHRRIVDECGALRWMRIGRVNWSTRRNAAPLPLSYPQIPHDLSWDRTRATASMHRGEEILLFLIMNRRFWSLYLEPDERWKVVFCLTLFFSSTCLCQSVSTAMNIIRPDYWTHVENQQSVTVHRNAQDKWIQCISNFLRRIN